MKALNRANLFFKLKKISNFFGFLLLVGLIIAIVWTTNYYGPVKLIPQRDKNFIIGLQDTQEQIIDKLYEQGFIKDKIIFKKVLDYKQRNIVNPGGFFISPSMWPYEIVNVLSSQSNQIWFILEQGKRREEIAFALKKIMHWSNADTQKFIENSKEGYLYPDTYLLNVESMPQEIIDKLQNELYAQIKDLNISDDKLNQVLTFASIIQRESVPKVDAKLVAGILQNRLNRKMPLQVDATVQYALGSEKAWWPRITSADYQIDHPYNTYKIKTLPPGPICAAGIDAIKAALNPQKTEYLYYLHDRNMVIHPSVTFSQHQSNMRAYLGI